MNLTNLSRSELDAVKKRGDKYMIWYYALLFPALAVWMFLVFSFDFSGWFLLLLIPAVTAWYFLGKATKILQDYSDEAIRRIGQYRRV